MAKGNTIIVSGEVRGRFLEGKIATGDTPKPGTVVQIQASAGLDANERFTFEDFNADADGGRPKGPLCVLLMEGPHHQQGKLATTAYAAGDACQVYVPLPGDELNMLFQNQSGTADDVAFGDIFIVDDGTGKMLATTGTPETEPFMSLEAFTDPVADKLLHCIYTGY